MRVRAQLEVRQSRDEEGFEVHGLEEVGPLSGGMDEVCSPYSRRTLRTRDRYALNRQIERRREKKKTPHPVSPAGGTTAHRVLTSHNKPVPTTPYSPAGGTTSHTVY